MYGYNQDQGSRRTLDYHPASVAHFDTSDEMPDFSSRSELEEDRQEQEWLLRRNRVYLYAANIVILNCWAIALFILKHV